MGNITEKVDYFTVYEIYKKYLQDLEDNKNPSIEEAFIKYYQGKGITVDTKKDPAFMDYLNILNEAVSLNKSDKGVRDYLEAKKNETIKKEETTVEFTDEQGNTSGYRIESTAFDSSGKTNISSKMGSASEFEFEDESTMYLNPEKEEGYANSMIAARGADKNTSDIGTRDTFDTPEPLIIGEPVDTLDDGVDKKNVPSFGSETNASASVDDPNPTKDFVFGDDDNQSKDQGSDSEDNGLKF